MVRTDFSPEQVMMMISMLGVSNTAHLNLSSLARKLDTSPSNARYREIMNDLLAEGIVTVIRETAGSKFIKIHHKLLVNDVLDEQEHINTIVSRYLKQWHMFSWKPGL